MMLISLLFSLFLLMPLNLFSSEPTIIVESDSSNEKQYDIYERTHTLKDSLSKWSKSNENILSYCDTLRAYELSCIDNIYQATILDSSVSQISIMIEYPHHEFINNCPIRLEYNNIEANPDSQLYILTNISSYKEDSTKCEDAIYNIIDSDIKLYSSLIKSRIDYYKFLPFKSYHRFSKLHKEARLLVVLHGRDIDTIQFPDINHLYSALHQFSYNYYCYSAISDYALNPINPKLRMISIISAPDIIESHLLDITEEYKIVNNSTYLIAGITIELYPYIRNDNIPNIMNNMKNGNVAKKIDIILDRE